LQSSRFNAVEIVLLSSAAAVFLTSTSYLALQWHKDRTAKHEAKQAIARIVSTNKTVRIRASNSNQWIETSTNDPVGSQDIVFTDRSSHATLEFLDKSRIELGENSLVEISIIDGESSIDVERGQIKVQTSTKPLRLKLGKKKLVLSSTTPSRASLAVTPEGSVQIQPLTQNLNLELDGKKVDVPVGQQLQTSATEEDDEITISPAKFVLNAPDDDMMFPQGKDVAFAWQISNKANDEIFFEISNSRNFTKLIQRSSINTASLGMSFKFADAGEFHWRLASKNEFSESREFIVKNSGQMNIVIPAEGEKIMPADGSDCLAVSFATTAEPLCDRFDFEILAENASTLDTFSVSLPQNSGSTVLCSRQWTMKSRCLRGEQEVLGWSNLRHFTVGSPATPAQTAPPSSQVESGETETAAISSPTPTSSLTPSSTTSTITTAPTPQPTTRTTLAAVTVPSDLEFEITKDEVTDGTDGKPAQTWLRWKPVANITKYSVEIASDPTFAKPLLKETAESTSFAWKECHTGTFAARVSSIATDGRRSQPSAAKSLSIEYVRPKLVEPEYEAEYTVSEPTRSIAFIWKTAPCDSQFEIEVCEDKSGDCIFTKSATGNTISIDLAWKAGWYKWRIKSRGSKTPDDWTAFRSFLIKRESPQ